MKRFSLLFTVLIASLLPVGAQSVLTGGGGDHVAGGIFYGPVYGSWRASIVSGNATTGSVSITVTQPSALRDGYVPSPNVVYTTTTPITINDNNAETFTPTAVTIGPCPPGFQGYGSSLNCATLTGTLNNTHGAGSAQIVQSGDNGSFEAITDAGNLGGGLVFWEEDTGIVTLNTGGLTTTTTTAVPTSFSSMGAAARVTTTITTSTNWAVGISGSTSAFCTADATLTAGTTCIANQNSPAHVGTTNSLTDVLITVTGADAGAGAVKARVWGFTAVQPAQ